MMILENVLFSRQIIDGSVELEIPVEPNIFVKVTL